MTDQAPQATVQPATEPTGKNIPLRSIACRDSVSIQSNSRTGFDTGSGDVELSLNLKGRFVVVHWVRGGNDQSPKTVFVPLENIKSMVPA